MRCGARRFLRAIRLALAFLTVIPQRFREREVGDADLAASRFAYPFVGAALGLVLAGLSEALRLYGTGPPLAAFLLIAAGIGISGALHLDGLADSSDGLFLGGGSQRRLSVMRDPHVGSYGVAAIVLVLMGKYAALSSISERGRALTLLAALTISRTLVLVSAGLARYARPEGTGRILVNATTPRDALGAALLSILMGQVFGGLAGSIAAGFALILAFSLTRWATHKIGGVTGDTLGAIVELGEMVVLVTISFLGKSSL